MQTMKRLFCFILYVFFIPLFGCVGKKYDVTLQCREPTSIVTSGTSFSIECNLKTSESTFPKYGVFYQIQCEPSATTFTCRPTTSPIQVNESFEVKISLSNQVAPGDYFVRIYALRNPLPTSEPYKPALSDSIRFSVKKPTKFNRSPIECDSTRVYFLENELFVKKKINCKLDPFAFDDSPFIQEVSCENVHSGLVCLPLSRPLTDFKVIMYLTSKIPFGFFHPVLRIKFSNSSVYTFPIEVGYYKGHVRIRCNPRVFHNEFKYGQCLIESVNGFTGLVVLPSDVDECYAGGGQSSWECYYYFQWENEKGEYISKVHLFSRSRVRVRFKATVGAPRGECLNFHIRFYILPSERYEYWHSSSSYLRMPVWYCGSM